MKVIKFMREVRAEMAKVTWPSVKETRGMTIMVFILVVIVSIYLWIVDVLLSNGVSYIIGLE